MQVCLRFPSPCFVPSKPRIAILKSLSKDAFHFDTEWKNSTQNLKDALLKQRSYPLFGEVETRREGAERVSSDHTRPIVEDEWYSERVLLVGISSKRTHSKHYSLEDSLAELASLAETAGLQVMSQTHQLIDSPNPATYIGSGKVQELKEMVKEMAVSTAIFDEELSPVQLLNLERELEVRICDRTALILDIFSQQARSKEGKLQIELAMCNYQFPRLTRMWTHLERQTGGARAVKGMGEKQIEIDKRLLQKRINVLSRELEEVKLHRRLARLRRARNEIPVVGLVGYTNAGKSTLLNELTEAEVLVEDKLFATLDPTTRRLKLPTGKTALLSDTVGFIQKLPHQLLAAFGATLEELQDSSLLVHVIDISSPHALQQATCVKSVLTELGLSQLPLISVWNKLDQVNIEDRDRILAEAKENLNTFCVSSKTGEGIVELLEGIEKTIEESMVPLWLLVPYSKGDVVEMVYSQGVVKTCSHLEDGTLIEASIPIYLAKQLQEFQIDPQLYLKNTKVD